MGEPSLDIPAPAGRPDERLDSWKKIASYLKRDVTTVQRWERREAMPVHRHVHRRLGSVYAFRSELDAWLQRRSPPTPEAPAPESRAARNRLLLTLAPLGHWAILLAVAAALMAWLGGRFWLDRAGYIWHNPIAAARFGSVTDFDGVEQAATISRDGRLVAFLSDRSGH